MQLTCYLKFHRTENAVWRAVAAGILGGGVLHSGLTGGGLCLELGFCGLATLGDEVIAGLTADQRNRF